MLFSEKLRIMMDIFNITNNKLSKHLNIDASLVSRWKNGNRKPKHNQYYQALSEYFVHHARMEYQKMAICEAIGAKTDDFLDDSDLLRLLTTWFTNDVIEHVDISTQDYIVPQNRKTDVEVYYGIEGKREAVSKFLSAVVASNKSYELLLISEENMEWLIGDKQFMEKWSALLVEAIKRGNTIKVIHTIQRNTDELVNVVEKWLKLHLSGRVLSFYYPKYKENSYARTMFIAPNLLAITASSIFNKYAHTANYLFSDRQVINTLVSDYNLYLNECKPLMNILNQKNFKEFKEVQNPFEKHGNIITYSNFFPVFTISSSLYKNMVNRLEIDRKILLEIKRHYKNRLTELKNFLKFNSVTVIVEQKMLEMLSSSYFHFPLSDYHSSTSVSYLKNELILHIKHLIRMLKNYPNFNIYLLNKSLMNEKISICAKENEFIVATNLSNPLSHYSVVYNEKNITDSIYEFFLSQLDTISNRQKTKQYTIRKLAEILYSINDIV